MDPINLRKLTEEDIECLVKAERSYGDSWKKRGGVGAFMMLARKWDRLEKQVWNYGWDIFEAIQDDDRPEGVLDDIRDLRRYLLLVEEEMERESELRTPIPDEITEGITLETFKVQNDSDTNVSD
tara:strand:+ start:177 stop:551 length:375 start_codon:yes stop_codon:yes gene_type:complete